MSELSEAQAAKINNLPTIRTVASGQTVVGIATTVTVATYTRQATERTLIATFGVTDAAYGLSDQDTLVVGTDVIYQKGKTANANEEQLQVRNNSAASARTIDWQVVGVKP